MQQVKLNGDPFPRKVNGSHLKQYNGGLTMWLYEGSMVLALQEAERRCETINYTTQVAELHDWRIVQNKGVSQGSWWHEGSYATQGKIT